MMIRRFANAVEKEGATVVSANTHRNSSGEEQRDKGRKGEEEGKRREKRERVG